MTPDCLLYGAAISFIVSFLKRIPWVGRYPKIAATILSSAGAALSVYVGATPAQWAVIAHCVLAQLAAAVLTHETVTHAVNQVTGLGGT